MTDCLTGQRQYAHARPDDPLMHSARDSAQLQEHEAHPPLPTDPSLHSRGVLPAVDRPAPLHDYIGLHCAPDDIFGTHRMDSSAGKATVSKVPANASTSPRPCTF